MEEKLLDGKALADKLNLALQNDISHVVEKTGIKPKLVTVLVGEDPGSKVYVNIKQRTCIQVGIDSEILKFDASVSKERIIDEIKNLNKNEKVHGILLQMPLPNPLSPFSSELVNYISQNKDVDGLTAVNRGRLFDYNEELAPCTPKGIIALLEHYNIELKGKEAVIINRSNLVGKPLIFLLLKRNATVTICHTSTKNIDKHIENADILIVAVRQPKFITKEKIKRGVVIIDVGINRIEGKLYGDVDFEGVISKCSKITPVPGGIGPLTVSFLLQNTFSSYKKQMNYTQN
jgi:methylenetetrahydrofolate dehydrogenase (NADP+)/methenyltetrahydrofolate cyclohydrolase